MGAEDLASGRLLCLKIFRKDLLKKNRTEDSILNELKVYKRLASSKECCPATIFLMELERSFQTKKFVCFAMNLMSSDLAHYMWRESGYCLENARRWSAQLALGINALHSMGIIHRDIKLQNILIDTQQNVRITDFGLSYIDKEPKRLDTSWGYSSAVMGTINFMAPEILCNTEEPHSVKYGVSVDWWAFGCVFYELISLPKHEVLFDSKDAIMDYVAWHCKNNFKPGLFPSFQGFDPIAADLLAGLLNPLTVLRYGFQRVTNHQYFLNDDGTSEFHGCLLSRCSTRRAT
ncbi:kinase-like domain-containing protein [Suillus occidentalis]|nr:kinase-like domain-containing protein [Suillus occidentalis]